MKIGKINQSHRF